MSRIGDFYSGKNIFLTGSTGLVGLVLLEKLLRNVPNIGTIYLLLRPKSGKNVAQRLEEIKKHYIFEKLLESRSAASLFAKVVPVSGDIQHEELGLSKSDKTLLINNVNVIFNVAASIDFTDPLKVAIRNNVLGTRKVVDLAREILDLKVFIHVSSSYANTWTLYSEEKIYHKEIDVEHIIKLINSLSDKELVKMTPKILGDFQSVYTFSKYLAEYEILKVQDKFPCTMVRPSIITGTWQQPAPNYPINGEGFNSLIFGASKGVMRRTPGGMDTIYDHIPVDTVVNNLISAGCYAATNISKEATIYNCTTSTRNPFRWKHIHSYMMDRLHEYPLESAVWYPRIKVLDSYTLFLIASFFYHILPALLLDGLLIITGKKPMLTAIQLRTLKLFKVCKPFLNKDFLFAAKNWEQLQKWMSADDQKTYNLDVSTLNWSHYFGGLALGNRKYLSHESMDNISAARKKHSLFKILHFLLKGTSIISVWFLLNSVIALPFVICVVFMFVYCYIFHILM